MLAICAADTPVVFKAPKTSSKAESVSQGIKHGAKHGHKKLSTSSKQPSVSSKEATNGGSSKAPTSSKTWHSKKRKEFSSAMDSNLSQPPVYTPVSASGCYASVDSTAEADLGLSAPSDFVPQQQGMNEGTKNTLYDHLSAGTDPHVLVDKTKSVSEGLKTVLTQPTTGKGASSNLDSLEDDPVIVDDDSDKDEETEKDEVHPTPNVETKDTSVSKSSSLSSNLLFQCGTTQRAASKVLKTDFSNILSAHDFSSSLPTELKDLFAKLDDFTKNVTSVQAKLKTLDALLSLLLNVTQALNKFAQVLDSASSKAGDQSVPSAGQADTMHAEGEKNINQATIS
ncbi:hypothetical protein Tco_0662003 [Tanacetum coccineum]